MKILYPLAILVLLILLSTEVTTTHSQVTVTPEATTASTTNVTTTPAQPDTEVELLKAQLEEMRWYDQRLLGTVWGSLGLVFTLAIGLALYNGWAINRSYEQGRVALQQELQGYLSTEVAKLAEQLHNQVAQQIATIGQSVDDTLRTKGQVLDHTIDTKTEVLEHTINTKTEDLSHQLRLTTTKVDLLEYEHLELKADVATSQKRYMGALTASMQMYNTASKLGLDFYQSLSLQAMESALRNLNHPLQVDTIAEITSILNQLPPQYEIVKNDIREALTQAISKNSNDGS